MNAELLKAATEVVHNQQILVNIVSRRVRQLSLGHRPLVEFVPGMGHADVALTDDRERQAGVRVHLRPERGYATCSCSVSDNHPQARKRKKPRRSPRAALVGYPFGYPWTSEKAWNCLREGES